MGITKQYLRYAEASIFGIISGNRSNIQYIQHDGSKYILCGSCEYVFVWNTKKNELKCKLNSEPNKSHVSLIVQNPKVCSQIAVGYADGAIRIFDINTQECQITFNGHKSAITCLNFDLHGVRLVSGAQDTDLVMWDLVNESGLFRLRGHKAQITQAIFMSNANILITS
jgi:U3 small nucleolar RNA-associated protein 12